MFIAAIGEIAKPEMKNGQNVLFKNKLANRVDRPFYGQISNQVIFKKVHFILLMNFVVADSTNELWRFFFAQTWAANAWNAFLGLIFDFFEKINEKFSIFNPIHK